MQNQSGGGINQSVADEMKRLDKACATQSDSCTSPPYTVPLKIGCRAQNPQRVTFIATLQQASRVITEGVISGISRQFGGFSEARPGVLNGLQVAE